MLTRIGWRLWRRRRRIAAPSCGKCFEVCPTAREIGLDAGEAKDARRRTDGADPRRRRARRRPAEVAERLRRQRALHRRLSRGHQRPPVDHHRQDEGARGDASRSKSAPPSAANRFRHMAQAVRLLASMQLPSETLKKILAPAEQRTADVLFYTGCNVLRTPHIVLNVMDILDALELDFDVVGGTAHCCGVYQFQEADLPTYETHRPSHLPALRPVRRLEGADLVPDLHQEFRRAREGRRSRRRSTSVTSASSWPPTSTS